MFKVNNKDTSYYTHCSSVSVVNFEQVSAGWGDAFRTLLNIYAGIFCEII